MGMLDGRTCKAEAVARLRERVVLILVIEPTQALPGRVVIRNNRTDRMASDGDVSFKVLTYTRCRR